MLKIIEDILEVVPIFKCPNIQMSQLILSDLSHLSSIRVSIYALWGCLPVDQKVKKKESQAISNQHPTKNKLDLISYSVKQSLLKVGLLAWSLHSICWRAISRPPDTIVYSELLAFPHTWHKLPSISVQKQFDHSS